MKNPSSDSQYERTKLYHYISRERNSFSNTNYFFVGSTAAQMKSNDEMKWKVLSQTKMMDKLKAQAATTNFGGRQ